MSITFSNTSRTTIFFPHPKIEMNGPDHNRMNKQREIEKKLKQIKKWFVDRETILIFLHEIKDMMGLGF